MDPKITLEGALRGCLDCGVVVINPRGGVSFVNSTARKLLAIQGALPSSARVLPDPLPRLIDAALMDERQVGPHQGVLPANGSETRTATVEAFAVPFDNGQPGVLLLLRGLNGDNAFETRIRHFERLARLGVLGAGLAHELRNAMVALSTMTDLLIEQHRDNELAQTVRREIDRANAIAGRMLRYARPQEQSRKPVSTHQVLDRALQLADARFKQNGATVTKSLQANPDVIRADEAHLEQMFLNLLINAADAIEHAGEVTLSTDLVEDPPVGRAVRIAVKDTGVGIAPDLLPSLFEPFFTTKRHGTGLGLYLAHRIIHEHSGTINVDSSPGQGTCVQVVLPVHQA